MEYIYKEVDFDEYCVSCDFFDKSEDEYPCIECLSDAVNLHSKKPVNYKKSPKRGENTNVK